MADCEDFLSGQYDELAEDQCYMRGTMKGKTQ
jgi:F-type H+-transporting ATPase subunit beta